MVMAIVLAINATRGVAVDIGMKKANSGILMSASPKPKVERTNAATNRMTTMTMI